mmetsp:Transcript_22597/g.44032  ORF Transcript_22597/g.44032 Transcript_22597/m.44032 type:complete len:119 (+) Transcript_22597:1698-2054(+)
MDKVNESPERRLYILDTLKQMCAYEMKDIERLGGNAKALQAEIDGNAQDLKDKLIAAESGAPLSAKADPEPSLTKSSESLVTYKTDDGLDDVDHGTDVTGFVTWFALNDPSGFRSNRC